MTSANVKGLVVKGMLGAVAMGAMLFAGTAKAQAQGFAVGVQFGGPAYYPQTAYYGAPGYYERDARRDAFLRHEAEERREAFRRQQQWEHRHDFDRDRRFDRDDRGFDRDDRRWR